MHPDAIETGRMAIYLNAALAGHAVGRFWDDRVQFLASPGGQVIAGDPLEWLSTIEGSRGFNVVMCPEGSHSGVPVWFQPYHWVLQSRHSSGTTAWRPSYEIQDQFGSSRRLCLVRYLPDETQVAALPRHDITRIAESVSEGLGNLIALTRMKIPGWRENFEDLLAILEGQKVMPMSPSVPESVLSELPRRLVAVVFAAQVFTGMGNWGDNIYDDDVQPEAERLTEELFKSLVEALPAAVETTRPKR